MWLLGYVLFQCHQLIQILLYFWNTKTHSLFSFFISCYCIIREGVRGVAGVATATPIFQVLFYKIVLRMVSKIFLFTVGYTNLKFLTPSLHIGDPGKWFIENHNEPQIVHLSHLCMSQRITCQKLLVRSPNR